MSKKVLLIGAGPTSTLIAYKLKSLTFKFPLEIVIWEKARGAGGRFSTSRSTKDEKCIADLGAQYLTRTTSRTWTKPYFDCLIQNNLIHPFSTSNITGFRQNNSEKENYICSKGTASIVKFFLNQADVKEISFNRRVVAINPTICDDSGVRKIQVIPENEEETELFDVVISTIPPPQILQLRNADDIITNSKMREDLTNVKYSSRYALGLFYKERLTLKDGEGAINYVDNDPVLRYWTLENEKRGLEAPKSSGPDSSKNDPSSIVVHTTTQFGADNVEKGLDEMKSILMKQIEGRIKTIEGITPEYVKCHKWRYSQVDEGYAGSPGFIEISRSPIFLGTGDGFTFSGFEGCILAAEKTLEHLVSSLNQDC